GASTSSSDLSHNTYLSSASAATISPAPSGTRYTLQDIQEWTKNNRTRIFFGADGSPLAAVVAAILKGDVPNPFKRKKESDKTRNDALKSLSQFCYPYYTVSGFSVPNPACTQVDGFIVSN